MTLSNSEPSIAAPSSGVPVRCVRAGTAGAETRAVGDTGPVGAVDDEHATTSEPTAASAAERKDVPQLTAVRPDSHTALAQALSAVKTPAHRPAAFVAHAA
jgi:hypothetical protein